MLQLTKPSNESQLHKAKTIYNNQSNSDSDVHASTSFSNSPVMQV